MIKHVVMWKVKNSEYKQNELSKMKMALESLKSKIPQIRELEVGIDYAQTDASRSEIVLNSAFASLKDLEIYQNHPEHKKVVELIRTLSSEKRVVDYIL